MLSQIFNKQKQTNTDNHIRADITTIFFATATHHHQTKTLQTQISFHPTDTHFAKSI